MRKAVERIIDVLLSEFPILCKNYIEIVIHAESRRFDAIIIGTGQAGPPLAARFSSAGMTVAIIERHKFGGTCVNTGCIPTKTLVASAYAAYLARRGADYGVAIGENVQVDMKRVKARKMMWRGDRSEVWNSGFED
jgi:pyruvate/2-oxoglutarate dehydrogenase complex dihydrolipoamide dehydrogenase (E3) component